MKSPIKNIYSDRWGHIYATIVVNDQGEEKKLLLGEIVGNFEVEIYIPTLGRAERLRIKGEV